MVRDSNGAVLVYDITDEDSFQKVPLSLLLSSSSSKWMFF